MIIVLLGPPGAGKGTQAHLVSEKLEIPSISTGDMFRQEISAQTDLGRQVKSIIDAGNLVPDAVTIAMIQNRITREDCKNGFILDGFPRTVAQAEALDNLLAESNLNLNAVLCFEVDDEEIIKRRGGRLTAPTSGRIYHTEFNPPKVAGKCDKTGEDLVQRDDDKEDVVRNRLEVYAQQTAPLKEFYAKKSKLITINGAGAVEEVFKNAIKALQKD